MKEDRVRRESWGWTRVPGFPLLFPSWAAPHAAKPRAELAVQLSLSRASLPPARRTRNSQVLRSRQVHVHPQRSHPVFLVPTLAGNAAERQRGPAAQAARTRAREMSVILGCVHEGGGRNAVSRPHGTRSPLQGCCLQCSRLRFQPEQENLERVQKRAGSESRQWKICITVTERRSSGCLVY